MKAKQTAKMSTLVVDKMPSTKKESSNDKKSRSNLFGKIATNPVKSEYFLRPKSMYQLNYLHVRFSSPAPKTLLKCYLRQHLARISYEFARTITEFAAPPLVK